MGPAGSAHWSTTSPVGVTEAVTLATSAGLNPKPAPYTAMAPGNPTKVWSPAAGRSAWYPSPTPPAAFAPPGGAPEARVAPRRVTVFAPRSAGRPATSRGAYGASGSEREFQ